jgi:DNA repair protein RecO (recombination protein O)
MHSQETEAIILATSDHGESDRLVTFLTRTGGKLRGIAKGARRSQKRFIHAFEPLSLVLLQYRERSRASLAWVEACKLLEPHMALRESLDRWGYAALLAEVMVALVPERDSQEELFAVMETALRCLETDRDIVNAIILALYRILAALGYMLDLSCCSECRRPSTASGEYWLHFAGGRLLCGQHEPAAKGFVAVDLGTLILLRRAREVAPEQLWRLRLSQRRKASVLDGLLGVVRAQLGRELKSVKFLRDMGSL